MRPRRTGPAMLILAVAFTGAVSRGELAAPAAVDRVVTDEASAISDPAVVARLDAARLALVELRFEDAVSEIDSLLAGSSVPAAAVAEGLILRAEARTALGEWEALERDYRAILAVRPDFTPDPRLTPARARELFDRVRAVAVGQLELVVLPLDARVTVDGRPLVAGTAGTVPLAVGEHAIEISQDGYDAASQSVTIAAAATTRLELRLVPNARSVLVLTEPEGVVVTLDGETRGVTSRSVPGEPARLLLQHLPLGEHAFGLDKPCHRGELRHEVLLVDMTQDAPYQLGPIRLQPAQASLALAGEPAGATVSAGGRDLGVLPLESDLCPGDYELEIRSGARRVWSAKVALQDGERMALEISPRPNVVLAGLDEWPEALERVAVQFNTVARGVALPAARAKEFDWKALNLPPDADLVITRSAGDPARWQAFSPALERATPFDPTRDDFRRKPVERAMWGFDTADSASGGSALIVRVEPGGAAAAAGLEALGRIVELGGAAVTRSQQVRAILDGASPRRPIDIRWTTAKGEMREGKLEARVSPLLEPSGGNLFDDAVRIAWCRAEEVLGGSRGHLARAAMGLLYEAWGKPEMAVDAWRRVLLEERPGIARGTAQYYLGRVLMSLGRWDEARKALEAAALSQATALHDGGPPIAPAARDRLLELAP